MRISPINCSTQYLKAAQKPLANKSIQNSQNISFGDLEYGISQARPEYLKDVFNIEDISDEKVGKKYLLHPKDSKYKNLTILFTPETTIERKSIKTDDIEKEFKNPNKKIAFRGQVWGSIRKDETGTDNVMKRAYTDFYDAGMRDLIHYTEASKDASKLKDDYNFYIPSDGDGTRYKDITKLQGGVTKPASRIPAQLNGRDMRLVQGILANFAKTTKLNDKVGFIEVKPAQGSAFAFLEGLKSGEIPTDKPIVFSWGDNFSDINITKLMLYHEKNNSGFTMLTLPVNRERIQSLGAAKVKNNNNLEMTDFVEKPTDNETLKKFVVPGTKDEYLGVVGPYVLSPAVLSWIKENYTVDPESFKNKKGEYDFSGKIIGRLVKEMAEHKIQDKDGNTMLMYAYEKPEADTWSDLGSQKDFSAEIKKVKQGGFKNLPSEMQRTISKNVDRYGNITFDQKARRLLQDFLDEYEIDLRNSIVYAE